MQLEVLINWLVLILKCTRLNRRVIAGNGRKTTWKITWIWRLNKGFKKKYFRFRTATHRLWIKNIIISTTI